MEPCLFWQTSFDIRPKPSCCQPRLSLSPCRTWRARNPGAPAAASAMTKSRCPVRARRLARPSPQNLHDAAKPRPKRRAARRERVVAQWRRQYRRSVDSYERRHALRQFHRYRRHLQRQNGGAIRYRSSQSEWRRVRSWIGRKPELDHVRALFQPQRIRHIPTIRWLCRELDRSKAVAAVPGDGRGQRRIDEVPFAFRRT